MAAIITRRPWKQQPQTRVELGPYWQRDAAVVINCSTKDILCFTTSGQPASRTPSGVSAQRDNRGGIGYSLVDSGSAISGNDAAGLQVLGEIASGSDFTFFAYVDNVGIGSGANSGFWRSQGASDGTTFCIAQNTTNRPWIRLNGSDVLLPASGPAWATGQSLLIFFRVKSGVAYDCWWDGKQQHTATGSTTTPDLTGNAGIWNFGYQFDLTGVITGTWLATGVMRRALDDAELEGLSDNPWQLFMPRVRRLYFAAAAGDTLMGQVCL